MNKIIVKNYISAVKLIILFQADSLFLLRILRVSIVNRIRSMPEPTPTVPTFIPPLVPSASRVRGPYKRKQQPDASVASTSASSELDTNAPEDLIPENMVAIDLTQSDEEEPKSKIARNGK